MNATRFYTLISDAGSDQFAVGKMKGLLYTADPECRIIDITHEVSPFNIVEAAHQLRSTYTYFPKGSTHIIHVHTYYDDPAEWIAFSFDDYYFIGPNNGVFSLVFEGLNVPVYKIGETGTRARWSGQVFAEAAGKVHEEEFWQELPLIDQFDRRIQLQPVVNQKEIRATVIHVDNYGNVVTNIDQSLFERVRNGRQFALYFKRYDPITYLSQHYGESEIGDTLCRFNSTGYLEIAMNLTPAADSLGLKLNDTIQIEFF